MRRRNVFSPVVLTVSFVCEKESVQPAGFRTVPAVPADEGSIPQGAVVIPLRTAELQESSQGTTRCFSSLSANRPGEGIWKVSEHTGDAC